MKALLALLALLLFGSLARAQDVQPVPPLSARVVDTVGLLSAAQREALEGKLAAFESQDGPQIVVLLVDTTQPEDIASYSQRVADAWKVGRREVGDGLVLVVAKSDRRVRIEVAKALEGAVPDLAARQIIERTITPAFKQNDYAGGLQAGVDALITRIRGEHLPAPVPRGNSDGSGVGGFDWDMLALFFFVVVPVAGAVLTGLLGRKLGSLATAAGTGALAWSFSTSMLLAAAAALVALVLVGLLGIGASGRRSGSGGGGMPVIWGGGGGGSDSSSDGGGFSSGGGGDFGGGGASGDW